MIACNDPKTIRDKMIALIAEEARAEPDPAYVKKLNEEVFHTLDHVPEDHGAFMDFVRPIIRAKQVELDKSPFAEAAPQVEEF